MSQQGKLYFCSRNSPRPVEGILPREKSPNRVHSGSSCRTAVGEGRCAQGWDLPNTRKVPDQGECSLLIFLPQFPALIAVPAIQLGVRISKPVGQGTGVRRLSPSLVLIPCYLPLATPTTQMSNRNGDCKAPRARNQDWGSYTSPGSGLPGPKCHPCHSAKWHGWESYSPWGQEMGLGKLSLPWFVASGF